MGSQLDVLGGPLAGQPGSSGVQVAGFGGTHVTPGGQFPKLGLEIPVAGGVGLLPMEEVEHF
jgi:hypothetical protein